MDFCSTTHFTESIMPKALPLESVNGWVIGDGVAAAFANGELEGGAFMNDPTEIEEKEDESDQRQKD
jgi:hypothetical protein